MSAAAPTQGLVECRQLLAPLAQVSDADLGRSLVAGDSRAKREAWQRFRPLVARLVRRGIGSSADVEDVVQDVFLCVFRRMPTLRDPAALRAFIIRIAMWTVRAQRRRYAIRWRFFGNVEPLSESCAMARTSLEAQRSLIGVHRLLERLKERDRMAFILRFIEGKEASEVAQGLGISVPTARRAYERAWKWMTFWGSRDPLLCSYVPSAPGSPPRVRQGRM